MVGRAVRVAMSDAEEFGSARKVKGFFTDKNGVCQLCGIGLGKRYTREQRRDHEKGFLHTSNHDVYKDAFPDARIEYITQMENKWDRDRRIELRDAATQLEEKIGASDWINNGDSTRLKAALFDAMKNMDTSGVYEALEQHEQAVRSSLVEQAAVTALGGDENAASTVATLVAGSVSRLPLDGWH